MDKEKLFIGVLFGIIAQILTFFQLQGQMKYEWFKNNYWLVVLMGIPVSMLFMFSVKNMVMAYGGQMWPSRLIGFSKPFPDQVNMGMKHGRKTIIKTPMLAALIIGRA